MNCGKNPFHSILKGNLRLKTPSGQRKEAEKNAREREREIERESEREREKRERRD